MGGRARAAVHSKRELSKWAKLGGRPRKLDDAATRKLEDMLSRGMAQAEAAEELGISVRTITRHLAKTR